MTDAEITVALAEKVMGWHEETPDPSDAADTGYLRTNGVGLQRWVETRTTHWDLVYWNPLKNIADTWMVVEALAKRDVLVSVRNLFDGDKPKWWVCTVCEYSHPQRYALGQWQTDADSAQRAICLAALEAVR